MRVGSARPAALVALLLAAALPAPARAFDCAKAAGAVETALCAHPEAKASDDAMVAAFGDLKASLDAADAKALLANQRSWLGERNARCPTEPDVAGCLAERNRARVKALLAKPDAGPGVTGRLAPVFVARPGSHTDYAVDVLLYRFPEPTTAGERAFDGIVDTMLAVVPARKDEPDDFDWRYFRAARIAYASDRLLSVPIEGYDFTGGAHGTPGYQTINVDLRAGRALAISDLLDAAGLTRAASRCLVDILAQKKERDQDPGQGSERADLTRHVRDGLADLAHWSFGGDRATVTYGPYDLGSYAEGAYRCVLPYADLRAFAKPAFPLPAP